jgi:non-specific serine/threonine protein kinase/serine/threonine-protein kinase
MPDPSHKTTTTKPSAGFYDLAMADDASADTLPSPEVPGSMIAGRYVLKSILGEGGTGYVWCAEQTQPVQRDVAIKIIRPGLVIEPVSARFQREHQVLAKVEHPNIAAVFDAGDLPDGRTFFVMEIVSGAPITSWCERHKATLHERLGIFLQACLAVQHAHQKGILHRDLKPSNVMVTAINGKPLVKVIDFGIAKALEGDLTVGQDVTLRGMVLGTPRYMSPEQAGLTGQDVDTRADVYALGVLLYELLTGTTPLLETDEKNVPLPELLQRIRQLEPEPPSRRAARLPSVPTLQARELRGDLDWIVLRALETDRERRYPTALALADDVQSYLRDEPVSAGPPGTGYRIKKWFVRNRSAAISATAVLISLAGGIVATWLALEREEQHRLEAQKQRQSAQTQASLAKQIGDQLQELLVNARKHAESGMNTQMLRKLADECAASMTRFADQPAAEAPLAHQLAKLYTALEERTRALPWFQRHWELLKKTEGADSTGALNALFELGWRSLALNKPGQAAEYLRAAAEGLEKLPNANPETRAQTLLVRKELARALSALGRHEEAIRLFHEVLGKQSQDNPIPVASWLRELADVYRAAGRLDESATALQRALEVLPEGKKYAGMRAYILGSVATTSRMREHYDEALAASSERIKILEEEHGVNHPQVLNALVDHAFLSCKCVGCPGGEDAARRALHLAQTAGHESRLADAWTALSEVLRMTRQFKASEQAVRDAIAEVSQTKAEHWRVLELHRRLGDLLAARSAFEEAQQAYETAAATWFTPPITGRAIEKERLIFESYIAFLELAAKAQSSVADDSKLAEWRQKFQTWKAAQPALPDTKLKAAPSFP